MPTLQQLSLKNKSRLPKLHKVYTKALKGAPHRLGLLLKYIQQHLKNQIQL